MHHRNSSQGGTLTELMVATVILSIGVLGLFSAFRFIARTTLISRATSLATNLGQERIETLKNLSYFALQITTATGTDSTVTPNITFDTVNYPPETISIGGITFTRYTFVGMAEMTGSDITSVGSNYPDTGLKQITTNIVWSEAGSKKSWTLRNLLENPNINPLDATVSGTVVNSAGGNVASAIVVVEQNPDWGATTGVTGAYSFSVYHGTYSVRASSNGFSDAVSNSFVASKGGTVSVPALTLTAVATGFIYGTLWRNPDLVISQVVAATTTEVGNTSSRANVEYIELYNPTTWPINIGTTGVYPKPVQLRYRDEAPAFDKDDSAAGFGFVHLTTYVAPGRYYLYANATAFYILGTKVLADAYYDAALSYPNNIRDDKSGTIQIYRPSTGLNIDQVGYGSSTLYWEGTASTSVALGTPEGKQIVRVSSPGISAATLANFGRAYDSDDNSRDFLYAGVSGFVYAPKNMASGAFTTLTGKVSSGAYVSASDTNSGSTLAYVSYITSGSLSLPYTRFVLPGVSTGTWTVAAAYGQYATFIETVTVSQNAYTGIPNAGTTPVWSGTNLYHNQMTSTTLTGFVKGVITSITGAPLNGIAVQGGGGSKITGSNGVYFMPVSSGTVTIIANPNNLNTAYVQGVESVVVTEGAVTTQNFTLSLGGRITGYITTGTTPLANQSVAATNDAGLQAGSGVTDTGGNFTMRNISTGTYTVFPVLESGQDASPNTLTATLTSAGSVAAGTFTVSGAFGSIAGTITDASGLVTSGALILASTNSIASTPAAIVGSSAPSQVPIYMVSSKADGTYTLPVRGGATYYLSAYIPVISDIGGVSVTTKTYSNISVAPSVATTKLIVIP